MSPNRFLLPDLFDHSIGHRLTYGSGIKRYLGSPGEGIQTIIDQFESFGSTCLFLRNKAVEQGCEIELVLEDEYSLESLGRNGWLLRPRDTTDDWYWIPQSPKQRKLDTNEHVLACQQGIIGGFDISGAGLTVRIGSSPGFCLDMVLWRISGSEAEMVNALRTLLSIEQQGTFMWSSHTTYSGPADFYLHLVHGHVYENHEVWPNYWRVCSELDAYALYVTLTGLLRATGKKLYYLLRTQVVFSVIARQADDGGWYHGEWTDHMESHYRLHAGGMHMLAAYYEETRDPVVEEALKKAAAFAASRTDRLDAGIWYLHDSLEESIETLRGYPFRYMPSRALGKSESNLLVLNTHLDTNIAMERSRQVTGDEAHADLIASARRTTQAVLRQRPADWLYRPLFKVIGLSFLPTRRGAALPLHVRALKRIGWKYLAPQLPRIKAWFPRLVMPGGFIERGLSQYGLSVRYQPVNLMDLVRTRRLFEEEELDDLLEESFAFTQQSGIKERWKEAKGKEDDALGFWTEALYHLCLLKGDARYRAWLAEAIMDSEDNSLGLSPSLLGANAEAVRIEDQYPCPSPTDRRLRVANLSEGERVELLVVNPVEEPIDLQWELAPSGNITWSVGGNGEGGERGVPARIPPRSWIWGKGRR